MTGERSSGPVMLARMLPVLAAGAFVFFAPKLLDPRTAREWWWAGVQLWAQSPVLSVGVLLGPVWLLLLSRDSFGNIEAWVEGRLDAAARLPGFALFGIAAVLCWLLRHTDLRIGDATFYATQLVPTEAFSERGAYLSYDELLSSAIGVLGYRYTHRLFHWDPITWYNVLGLAVTLGVASWLWVRRNRFALLSWPVLLMMVSGNWTQVGMGPVEHYGAVTAFLFLFGILAHESLRGRMAAWPACLAFSIGAAFHLLVAWFFPALVFLLWRRWRKESPDGRLAMVLAMGIPAVLTVSTAYFLGFDLAFFFQSHGAQAKLLPLVDRSDPNMANLIFYGGVFDPKRLTHVGCVLLLMGWPGLLMLSVLLPSSRGSWWRLDTVRFAAIFAAGGVAFAFLWNNELPYFLDQDLFGVAGLGLCYLAGVLVAESGEAGRWRPALLAAIASALCWRLAVLLYHSVQSPSYLAPWDQTVH